jgi:hypothetical protein
MGTKVKFSEFQHGNNLEISIKRESRIRVGINTSVLDPVRIRHYVYGSGSGSRFGSFHQQAKEVWKTLIFIILWLTYFLLFIFEEWCKCISNKTLEKKHIFFWHLVIHWRKKAGSGSADPDSYQNTHPQCRSATLVKTQASIYLVSAFAHVDNQLATGSHQFWRQQNVNMVTHGPRNPQFS